MKIDQSPVDTEMPIQGRRILLVARMVGGLAAVLYLASVFEEIYGNSFHVEKVIGLGKHSRWNSDTTLWLDGPLGVTAWAFFKLPPLVALWIAVIRPRLILKTWIWVTLCALSTIGILMVEWHWHE